MLCRKCGAELPEDAKTCQFCGATVTEDAEVSEDKDAQIRQRQINKMVEEKKQRLNEIQQRRDTKKAKQKRNKIILIVVLCATGVACAAMGGVYWNGIRTAPAATPVATLPAATVAPLSSPSALPMASVSPLPTAASSWEATGNAGGESSGANGAAGSASGNSSSSGGASGGSASSRGNASTDSSSGSSASSRGNASTGSSSGGSASSGGNTSTGSSSGGSATGGKASGQASAKNSGISTNNITAKLSRGEKVIEDNGRYYMTFILDGVRYYANVNVGATTAQVRDMTYTLDAVPTSDTYNGNTVYEITSMTKYNGSDYILPNSGTVLLTKNDISGMSKDDLALARNEIYARHGRKFQSEVYQQYFESKSWYKENPAYNYEDENANLNEIEIKNVQFIIDAEK